MFLVSIPSITLSEFCNEGSSYGLRTVGDTSPCGSKPGPLIRMTPGTSYKLTLRIRTSKPTFTPTVFTSREVVMPMILPDWQKQDPVLPTHGISPMTTQEAPIGMWSSHYDHSMDDGIQLSLTTPISYMQVSSTLSHTDKRADGRRSIRNDDH